LNKELTRVGIEDLFHFIHAHPEMEGAVERRIQKSGSYFQGYIRRGLAALTEEQERAGHRAYAPPTKLGAYSRSALGSTTPLGGSMVASGGLGGSAEDHSTMDNYHNALATLQRKFGIKRAGTGAPEHRAPGNDPAAHPHHANSGSVGASSTDLHGSHPAMVGDVCARGGGPTCLPPPSRAISWGVHVSSPHPRPHAHTHTGAICCSGRGSGKEYRCAQGATGPHEVQQRGDGLRRKVRQDVMSVPLPPPPPSLPPP
jgi:hypothetical protein